MLFFLKHVPSPALAVPPPPSGLPVFAQPPRRWGPGPLLQLHTEVCVCVCGFHTAVTRAPVRLALPSAWSTVNLQVISGLVTGLRSLQPRRRDYFLSLSCLREGAAW